MLHRKSDGELYFGRHSARELVDIFGSPLYVYAEQVLRERCRELSTLISYPHFRVNYSAKANTNIELLKIINSEGIDVDAMSPGEIYLEMAAGYTPDRIFYIGNNVDATEMSYAIEHGILCSVDSIDQLKLYGQLNPGGNVSLRINPGLGAGHHEKVVTAGKNTKFGINPEDLEEARIILKKRNLQVVGLNQHIGSLFLTPDSYLEACQALLKIALFFPKLEFVDFGGGFGIPYQKNMENRLDLRRLGDQLDDIIHKWVLKYGRKIQFKVEPGRYLVAECGTLLGTVHAVKDNNGTRYVGTDLGFNLLMRPVLYDSYHEIIQASSLSKREPLIYTIVGNICESGDILGKDRLLPETVRGDVLAVMDAGAYGMAMASNYNCRLRPAEVLIQVNGEVRLIRRRETFADIIATQVI